MRIFFLVFLLLAVLILPAQSQSGDPQWECDENCLSVTGDGLDFCDILFTPGSVANATCRDLWYSYYWSCSAVCYGEDEVPWEDLPNGLISVNPELLKVDQASIDFALDSFRRNSGEKRYKRIVGVMYPRKAVCKKD